MKRKLLIVSVLAILVAVTAAGTLAFFTDTGSAHNVITTGSVDIELNEWADEARTQPFEDQTGVMPGAEVMKIVEIKNTGKNAAYIRVRVESSVYSADKEQLPIEPVGLDINTKDWTYSKGYYYYNRALKPGEVTEPLFTTVTFDPQMGNEYQNATAWVGVNASAVQSANNGDDPLAAKGWPYDGPPEPTVAPLEPENP